MLLEVIGLICLSYLWWHVLSTHVISSGYHRYFAHRSFEAPEWYEWVVCIFGPLAGGGSVFQWASVHRAHHENADTDLDPYSISYQGFWKVLFSRYKAKRILPSLTRDLYENPRVRWQHNNKLEILLVLAAISLGFFGWAGFFVLFVMPFVWGYFGMGFLNIWCHHNGKIKNSTLVNLFTAGEGWHKNHHENPGDWQIGKKWWQWDPAAFFIRFLKT